MGFRNTWRASASLYLVFLALTASFWTFAETHFITDTEGRDGNVQTDQELSALPKLAAERDTSEFDTIASLTDAKEIHAGMIPVSKDDLDSPAFLKGRKPLFVMGSSAYFSGKSQDDIRKIFSEMLEHVDPSKFIAVDGFSDKGVEAIFKQVAREKGIPILGLKVKRAQPDDIGFATWFATVGDDWSDLHKFAIPWVAKHKGAVIAIEGRGMVRDALKMAEEQAQGPDKLKFFVRTGEGASGEYAKEHPERAFTNWKQLLGQLYKSHSDLFRPEKAKAGRDFMYLSFARDLSHGPTMPVSYRRLSEKAKSYKVVVLGGNSALGYKDRDAVRASLKKLMRAMGDHVMYVGGGTEDGIGESSKWLPGLVKEVADELGLRDVGLDISHDGIVSREAAKYGIAPNQKSVVFANTPVNNWEVKAADGESMFVKLAREHGGALVYWRGGGVANTEIKEALAKGVRVVIVDEEHVSAPDPEKVKKRLAGNPNYVVDGTSEFVRDRKQYPTLHVGEESFAQVAREMDEAHAKRTVSLAGGRAKGCPQLGALSPDAPGAAEGR